MQGSGGARQEGAILGGDGAWDKLMLAFSNTPRVLLCIESYSTRKPMIEAETTGVRETRLS